MGGPVSTPSLTDGRYESAKGVVTPVASRRCRDATCHSLKATPSQQELPTNAGLGIEGAELAPGARFLL